jgi:WS/DGAT/MGAT family acyltransferase
VLLTDRGTVPMNTGAVLVFDDDGGPAPTELEALLADRIATVARLRQCVHRPPLGGGFPVWVDDPSFRLEDHLVRRELAGSADRPALLDVAASLVCERLPFARPPWRAAIVIDSSTGLVTALVLVVHHVLADGLGGLAVLSALADPGLPAPTTGFPVTPPSYAALALDAARQRAHRIANLPVRLRAGLAGLKELGVGAGGPHRAGRTSLTHRTSGRRRIGTVEIPLRDVVAVAHAAGGTVNDVLLAAIGGAIPRFLAERGESPEWLVVSVPVSGRSAADPDHLGNQTGVRPVCIPFVADDRARLHAVIRITRTAAKARRASSSAPLGVAFRLLSRLGLFGWFVDRQHLVDTFETNLRGPVERLRLGGHSVRSVIPMAVNPGNVGVSFDVLSYAGALGVTVVADPVIVPDLDRLTEMLSEALARLCALRDLGNHEVPETAGRGPAGDHAPVT